MYFENTCKINNNGKISGYHKRGKVDENNNITYFINNSYGDKDELKRFPEFKPHFAPLGHSCQPAQPVAAETANKPESCFSSPEGLLNWKIPIGCIPSIGAGLFFSSG